MLDSGLKFFSVQKVCPTYQVAMEKKTGCLAKHILSLISFDEATNTTSFNSIYIVTHKDPLVAIIYDYVFVCI